MPGIRPPVLPWALFAMPYPENLDHHFVVIQGERALDGERKSLPSLLMISRELTKILTGHYPFESSTQEYLDHLRVLGGN